MKTLEQVIETLRMAAEREREILFAHGDALVAAVDACDLLGFQSIEALRRHIGSEIGMSRSALCNRERVARAFPTEPAREVQVSWSVYLAAAGTDDPAHWVAEAHDNNYGASELREEYRRRGKKSTQTRIERVVKAAPARAYDIPWNGRVRRVLVLDDPADEAALSKTDAYQTTVYREVLIHHDA